MTEQRPGTEERDDAIQDALIEAGTFGDLTAVIEFLQAGVVNQQLLTAVAGILAGIQADPKHQRAVQRRRKVFSRKAEVEEAFARREGDPDFGIKQKGLKTVDDLAWHLAAKFGFTDGRQVYNILKTPMNLSPPDWRKGGK